MSIDPQTGAVKAMVGGPDFTDSQYNIATHDPGRQPGSTWKVITLAGALANGYSPNDSVDGSAPCSVPSHFGNLTTTNAEGGGGGEESLWGATAGSINCAFVRLSTSVGQDKLIDLAHKMGIAQTRPTQGDKILTLSIGSIEATPLEMATVMATIASGGIHHTPYVVQKVVGPDGKVLIDESANTGDRVLDADVANCEQNVLRGVVTGRNRHQCGHHWAGDLRQDRHHRPASQRVVHRREPRRRPPAARDVGMVRLRRLEPPRGRVRWRQRRPDLPGLHEQCAQWPTRHAPARPGTGLRTPGREREPGRRARHGRVAGARPAPHAHAPAAAAADHPGDAHADGAARNHSPGRDPTDDTADRPDDPTPFPVTTATEFDALLTLQEHDGALDRLRHRRATLPEREALALGEADAVTLDARIVTARAERDAIASEEQRIDDEVRSLAAKATEVDQKMYSGEISSPRELQSMQADIDQLRRHQRGLENRELELMEAREPLEATLSELESLRVTLSGELDRLHRTLADAEAVIDAEAIVEAAARTAVAATIADALVAEYERCRVLAHGVGVARLVGTTCQGCHLSIPATESERIKKVDRRRDRTLRQLRLHPRPVSGADAPGEPERDALLIYADGGARGNPGPAAIGAVVLDPSTTPPTHLATVSERIGSTTNNVAEYRAVIAALETATRFPARSVEVRADSMLVIEQLNGRWKVKQDHLKPLHAQARALLDSYDDVALVHVPRAQNADADALVNAALDLP